MANGNDPKPQEPTPNEPKPQEPAGQQPQEPANDPNPAGDGQQDDGIKDSHGQPGINKERHDREVAALKDKIADLQKQLDEAAETKKGRDELAGKLKELEAALETERSTSKLERSGCIDAETALLLLPQFDGDVEKLKSAKPYLFEADKKGQTGLKPSGPADDAKTRQQKADEALGYKPPKK